MSTLSTTLVTRFLGLMFLLLLSLTIAFAPIYRGNAALPIASLSAVGLFRPRPQQTPTHTAKGSNAWTLDRDRSES